MMMDTEEKKQEADLEDGEADIQSQSVQAFDQMSQDQPIKTNKKSFDDNEPLGT